MNTYTARIRLEVQKNEYSEYKNRKYLQLFVKNCLDGLKSGRNYQLYLVRLLRSFQYSKYNAFFLFLHFIT